MQKILLYKQPIIAFAALTFVLVLAYYSSGGRLHGISGTLLSVKDLIGGQVSQTCTFTSLAPEADTRGTVYVAGKMMRGDFETTIKSATGGRVVESHMIMDHTHAYVWSAAMSGAGIKMTLASIEEQKAKRNTQGESALFDIYQPLNLECSPWLENPTFFTPPTQIKFQDMSTMMDGTPQNANATPLPANLDDMKRAQCAACDQAGPNRAMCRSALSCP